MPNIPNHIAIILDGNGRWAKKRGLPRNVGHYNGAKNLFTVANAANKLGVKFLTVYAFSTENWKRPEEEVDYLMNEPIKFLKKYENRLDELNFKIVFVGKKDRIPKNMQEVINRLELATSSKEGMTLQIAFDYGSKEEIVNAFNQMEKPFEEDKVLEHLYVKQEVDLLIRTSGEQRLSNFLLWQVSYAEFVFVKKHWPSFKEKDLHKAIKTFNKRNRRFGGLK